MSTALLDKVSVELRESTTSHCIELRHGGAVALPVTPEQVKPFPPTTRLACVACGVKHRESLDLSRHSSSPTQSTFGPDAAISLQENLLVVARLPPKIPALVKA